jgi:hypothetical protein
MKAIFAFTAALLATQTYAFELRSHSVAFDDQGRSEVEVRNSLDNPIIVRIDAPEGVRVFPRRAIIAPGSLQKVKARLMNDSLGEKPTVAFRYIEDVERVGSRSRLSIRIPVETVSESE